jgi:hypothetical protein
MDAAMNPAISIFHGLAGTIAAVMRMIGPIQLIIGRVSVGANEGSPQWIRTPMPNAMSTMWTRARSMTNAASRWRARR